MKEKKSNREEEIKNFRENKQRNEKQIRRERTVEARALNSLARIK